MKKTISVLLIFCTILGLLVFPIDSVAESNDPKGPSDKVTDILWYSPTGKGKMFITNGIGYRNIPVGSKKHHGTDYRSADGSPLYAPYSGIAYSGYTESGGYFVLIDHENGYYTCCRHMQGNKLIKNNTRVEAGEFIGNSGNTGTSTTGAHLHFEMAYCYDGKNNRSSYYSGITGGAYNWGNSKWITMNPSIQNYTTDKNLVGDYSNAANTLEFRDIVFPATYKISSSGWNQVGGIIVSDAKIVEVKSQIVHVNFYNKDKKFIAEDTISETKTPYKPNAKLFSVFKLDNDSKEDNGVKFSYIDDEGDYEWRLTAIDENENEHTLVMPFKAVKQGENKLDKKSGAYDSKAASFKKYSTIQSGNTEFFQISRGNGDLKQYPYAESKTLKTLKVGRTISQLTKDDVLELLQIVENIYEKNDPGKHLWGEVRQVSNEKEKYFKYFGHLSYLYRKVDDCYFPFVCEQQDIKILPFADAKNYLNNAKGKQFYAVAQYVNKYGNTWYGVADFDDADKKEIGFVNINNVNKDAFSGKAYIDQLTNNQTKELLYPSGVLEKGKSKTIGGVIHTESPIYEVRVEVYSQTKGKVQTSASCFPNETAKAININSYVNGNNINYMLKFGSLDVDYYSYRIWVVFGRKVNGVAQIDGSEKIFEKEFQVGNPSVPNPQKENENSSGIIAWLKDLFSFNVNAKEDPTGELNTATITWLNEDGSVFDSTVVKLGTVPTHERPVKANANGKSYVFSGWTPDVSTAFGSATYQAVFSEVKNSYTITWKSDDGTVIDTSNVEYGKVPTHVEPQKAGSAQTGYVFAGWEPNVVAVTGNAEYKATFTPYTRWYAVTWQNADGTILKTDVLDYGTMPAYTGETPAIPNSDGYNYTFSGWTPEVVAVTGPATYQAVFTKANQPVDEPAENTTAIEIDLTYQYDAASYAADLVNSFRTSNTWYWNENNTGKMQVSGLKALTYDKELEKIAMQNAAEAIIRPSGDRPDGSSFSTAYNFNYSAIYPLTFGFRITNSANAASAVREAIKNNIDNLLQENGNYSQQYTRRVMLSNAFKYIGAGCVYVKETNAYYVTLVLISDAGKNGPSLTTPARMNVSEYNLEHYFTDLSASPAEIAMEVGDSVNLPVVTAKSTLGFKPTVRIVSASWSTSNDTITVSNGKVKGQRNGTASLKATVGSKEVTVNVTVGDENQNSYYTYSGAGQNFVKASGEDKQFSVKRAVEDEKTFSLFTGIQVDGSNVDRSNYEATSGSVVINLKASYLETLAVGDHVMTVLFTDGKDDIPFTVSAAETPVKPIDPTKFVDVAVPSDSFTFKKVWQGDHEDSIDFTLYKADGSVYHHGFDKRVVSKTEWRYNAYFSAPAACYVIEKPVPGYQIKYVNVGVYADVTDRCCDGGTIINKKVPKTGDAADFALWAGIIVLGVVGLTTTVILTKRKKAHK